MKGMFWNSRGLGDLAKYKHISDCVRDHALDFVAISECSKRDFPSRDLDHFSCGKDYEWHILPPSGRSGGILLGIHSTYLKLLSTSKGSIILNSTLETNPIISFGAWLPYMVLLKMNLKRPSSKNLSIPAEKILTPCYLGGTSIFCDTSRIKTMIG